MKSNASLFYSLLLVVGDFLALVAAFVGAYALRGTLSTVPVAHPIPATTYIGVFLALLPFWILFFAVLGLYSSSIQEKRFNELGRLLIGSFVGLLFVISYGYAVNRTIFPARLVPVYAFVLAFLFLVIFRNLARSFRAYLYKYGVGITNVLIIGNTKVAGELVRLLSDSKISGYKIVGIVGNKSHTPERFPHIPVFDSFTGAVAKLRTSDIHGIVQTELYDAGAANNEILEFAQTKHIAFRFVPGNSELFVGNTRKIYKFRTHKKAYTNMTPEEAFTKMGRRDLITKYRAGGDHIPNDPRVSYIGRFLRRTSMDELPQLINIVKGDISLVGPRALQPQELETADITDLILAVKSGLTGLAQVSGRRDISVEERRKLDLYYVQNWSLWLDLIILAKTIRVVLGRIGAK